MGMVRLCVLVSLDGSASTSATTRAVLRESVEATSSSVVWMRLWMLLWEKLLMVLVKRIFMLWRLVVGLGDGIVGDGVGDIDDDDAGSANRGDG